MKGGRGSIVQLLRPVLDTYMDSAVGLTGCRALGIERESCEYDVVVVGAELRTPATIRAGDAYMDVFFLTEEEATAPTTPEIAVSLASVKPVKDTTLVLSACTSAAREALAENSRRSADEHLTSSIKAMGRADDALSKGMVQDADFLLLTAGYDFAFAWLYSEGDQPAPSHILAQLKHRSRGQSLMYEAFSSAAGLEGASRSRCEERLDGLSVIYDLKEAPAGEPEAAAPTTLRVAYEIVRRKSEFLVKAVQPVDCYAFLGLELARGLPETLRARTGADADRLASSGVVSALSKGKNKLIGESLVRALGLGRDERAVRTALAGLRLQVSALARKT
ncbi:MAG: hypothetical protein LYZ66_04420 [Nitrososphaerales archaeon]|nr:hypothetical protein [Nitrososphaerales archaeon]